MIQMRLLGTARTTGKHEGGESEMTEREQLGVLKQSTIKLLGEVSTNEAQNALITVLAGFVRLETDDREKK